MDIFQGSKELEDAALKGIEWGLFLRHDLASPIQSFMILHCGAKKVMRVIVDDENPLSVAKKLLETEEESFNYVTIGAEVALKGRDGNKVDAILVEAYDVSLEKGISLCQSFKGKEDGEFQKIGHINLVSQPELGIPTREKVETEEPEPTALNGIQTKDDNGLVNHVSMLTDTDSFQLAYEARKYLRAKLSDETAYEYSGKFEIIITPNEKIHREFLDFMLRNVYSEIVQGEEGSHWEESTNRKLDVTIKYDEDIVVEKEEDEEVGVDSLLGKPTSSDSAGKSGCMGAIAFISIGLFIVYMFI